MPTAAHLVPLAAAAPAQGRERVKLIHLVASMGFDVIFSDIDAVWLRNPLPFLQQVRAARHGVLRARSRCRLLGLVSRISCSTPIKTARGWGSQTGHNLALPPLLLVCVSAGLRRQLHFHCTLVPN